MKIWSVAVLLVVGLWMTAAPGLCANAPIKVDSGAPPLLTVSLQKSAAASLKLATDFLVSSQAEDGSWANDPAITALVVYGLLLNPGYNPEGKAEAAASKGVDCILGFVQPDGGIYRKEYSHYVTAVCLMALAQTNNGKYKDIIAGAKKYLIEAQLDEGEGLSPDKPFYGGIGYGGDDRPDLSNTQLALESIKAAEDYEKRLSGVLMAQAPDMERDEKELGLHWQKALAFVNRCQNFPKVNDMPYAGKDGGFIYETGLYKQDRSHSYGSMTYAGVKSLLYANVGKDDERVQQAVEWIRNNYSVDFNPGFGTYSIFYYYMTFAKCLAALGEEVIVDGMGQEHRWREDLVSKLVSLQNSEGFWQNPSNRYWENVKPLATAYSVIAMKFALASSPQPLEPATPAPQAPPPAAAPQAPQAQAVAPSPPPQAAAPGAVEKSPIPEVLSMEDPAYAKHSRAIVSFSHARHFTEYKIACGQCHHDESGKPLDSLTLADPVKKCSACHATPGLMPAKDKKGASDQDILKFHAEAMHENCVTCHKAWNKENGKTSKEGAPASCLQCHKK